MRRAVVGSQLSHDEPALGERTAAAAEEPRLIIRTCKHILESGACCRQPAVAGRKYCRAHLELRLRRRKMARARRRHSGLQLPRHQSGSGAGRPHPSAGGACIWPHRPGDCPGAALGTDAVRRLPALHGPAGRPGKGPRGLGRQSSAAGDKFNRNYGIDINLFDSRTYSITAIVSY